MTKLKNKKSILKRFKISSGGKIMHRPVNQGHFNAKESGNLTRKKRRNQQIAKADFRALKKQLPKIKNYAKG